MDIFDILYFFFLLWNFSLLLFVYSSFEIIPFYSFSLSSFHISGARRKVVQIPLRLLMLERSAICITHFTALKEVSLFEKPNKPRRRYFFLSLSQKFKFIRILFIYFFATGVSPQFSNRNYQHQPYPEPPEPIIEIVIQDNEESLPPPEPIVTHQDGKPKKEQVQVFYVKYKKDDNNQLVIGRSYTGEIDINFAFYTNHSHSRFANCCFVTCRTSTRRKLFS